MADKVNTITSTTPTDWVKCRGRTWIHLPEDTWDTAELKLQFKDPNGVAEDVVGAVWSAGVEDVFDFPEQITTEIRLVANSVGAGTSLKTIIRSRR